MKEILDFFAKNPVFFFATVDNNEPKVRPFGFIMEYDGKLAFTTGADKDVYKQMEKNPKFEICGMDKEGKWLRLKGKAVLERNNLEAKKKAFELYPDFKKLYQTPENENFVVFYATDVGATLYSMADAPKKLI